MRISAPLLIWALILGIGGSTAHFVSRVEPVGPGEPIAAQRQLTVAELFARAQAEPAAHGAEIKRRLAEARRLAIPFDFDAQAYAIKDIGAEHWLPPTPRPAPASAPPSEAAIGPPEGATKLLRTAMARGPGQLIAPLSPMRSATALAAISAAAPSPTPQRMAEAISTYGQLQPDIFSSHRLTILQLGDSHTAADFFSGRVRERLQQVFGAGGDAYIVPGRPHIGVRSALFDTDASDGWNYEALQKSDARRRFYLSGFNAIAHHAGATLGLHARNGRAYDSVQVAFLKEPGGGKAQVLVDGSPSGQVDLDGAAGERATITLKSPQAAGTPGFHDISVKSMSDAPVTVTGVEIGREGDGVSYLSLGFPGATVQLLQKLTTENIADDFRRISPDVVVLAFGTNEGFNDNLDVAAYTAQYEQIVRRLTDIRPGLRVVIVGPPDAARPNGVCHSAGVGQDCGSSGAVVTAEGGGQCRHPVPPKLGQVREAQRHLAERLGAAFWDWSSAMPGPCGAQIWAAANPPLMARDYVHMTLEGYKQSADRFADYLIPLIQGRQNFAHVVSNN